MKKSLYLIVLGIGLFTGSLNTAYTAQKNLEIPQEQKKTRPNMVRRFASWIFRDELTTLPTFVDEIEPYQQALSNATELLNLLTELKDAISKEEVCTFLKKITQKSVENKTNTQPVIPDIETRDIETLLETNKNNANTIIVYILDNAHCISHDACRLGKKILIPLELENEEPIEQALTAEFISEKIQNLQKFKQENIMHVGEIAVKYKNVPLMKSVIKFLANKLIFIPLKITLVIIGTAALIQIGALGTSYFIPSIREAFPSLTRIDYCLTPLYRIGSFLSSFFPSKTVQSIPCEIKEVEKIIEKPTELYKKCEEFVSNSRIELTPEHKEFYIKKCIQQLASADTRKIFELYGVTL